MTDTLITRLRQIDIGERDCAEAADRIEELQAEFTAERRKYDRLHDVWAEDLGRYSELASETAKLRAEVEKHKLHIKNIGNDALRTENAALQSRLKALEGQEPVAYVVSIGNGPISMTCPVKNLDLLSTMNGAPLFLAPGAAPQAEHSGCACRWDADDNRVATCTRHQGWLDVVSEWADRAKDAEAKLAEQAQPERAPLSDAEIDKHWVAATIEQCSFSNCYKRGFKDAERLHDIKQGGQHDQAA